MSVLELEADPQSVGRARSWVVGELSDLGRDDLVDSAELGISELVTNAILHADPPITVRLGGTSQHPRVEVHDSSRRPPTINADMAEESQLLRTVGRGLGIVALYSSRWGTDVSAQGKVVWFEPALEPTATLGPVSGLAGELVDLDLEDDPELAGLLDSPGSGVPTDDEALLGDVFDLQEEVERRLSEVGEPDTMLRVELLGMPVQVFATFREWYAEVRRELRLLALAHEDEYPVAAELAEVTLQVEQERFQARGVDVLDDAIAHGLTSVDLEYDVPPSAPVTMARLGELLDRVDDFCREHLLLSMPETPQMVAVRRWYFGEFVRQSRSLPPRPWDGGYDVTADTPQA